MGVSQASSTPTAAYNSLFPTERSHAISSIIKNNLGKLGFVVRFNAPPHTSVFELEEIVRGLIREQGQLYTEQLLSAVLEAGFDYHALPVVMMVGGAAVVSRHIRPTDAICRTVTLLDDRVNA